jgi:hypothetical protein
VPAELLDTLFLGIAGRKKLYPVVVTGLLHIVASTLIGGAE